jgi:hypothetical protein
MNVGCFYQYFEMLRILTLVFGKSKKEKTTKKKDNSSNLKKIQVEISQFAFGEGTETTHSLFLN